MVSIRYWVIGNFTPIEYPPKNAVSTKLVSSFGCGFRVDAIAFRGSDGAINIQLERASICQKPDSRSKRHILVAAKGLSATKIPSADTVKR